MLLWNLSIFFALICLIHVQGAFSSRTPAYQLAFDAYIDHTNPSTGNYTLSYYINGSQIHFEAKLVGMAAWIGCGFHSVGDTNDGMKGADIYFFSFLANGTAVGMDANAAFPGKPTNDTVKGCVDNIIPGSVSGTQTATTTTVYWARDLVTQDPKTCDAQFTPGKMKVLYAAGKRTNTFGFHGTNAGQTTFDFIESGPTTTGTHTNGPPTHSSSSSSSSSSSPTSSPTSTSADHGRDSDEDDGDKLSSNEIIVIVIGTLAIILGAANVALGFIVRNRRRAAQGYSSIE